MKPKTPTSALAVLTLIVLALVRCTSPAQIQESPTIKPMVSPTLAGTPTSVPSIITEVNPTLDNNAPEAIPIEYPSLYPESIVYDTTKGQFLIGSVTQGTIFAVADDGSLSPFVEDDQLESSGGLEIDYLNNRLLIAITSLTGELRFPYAYNGATLAAYDLRTQELIFLADLATLDPDRRHLANDVAVALDGTAYVTDSRAPLIYQVDIQGSATIFLEDPALRYINGIVAHPDGFLILGAYPNKLFRVPLDDPRLVPIELPPSVGFDATDGMVLVDEETLAMVTFPASVILLLGSNDGWETTTLEGISREHSRGYATSIAMRDGEIYALHSYLNHFQNGLSPVDEFFIKLVTFE